MKISLLSVRHSAGHYVWAAVWREAKPPIFAQFRQIHQNFRIRFGRESWGRNIVAFGPASDLVGCHPLVDPQNKSRKYEPAGERVHVSAPN